MGKTIIIEELKNTLRETNETRYFINEKLNKNRVIEDLYRYDTKLINAFIKSALITKHFIKDIDGNKVIKLTELIDVFEAEIYWGDSYSNYENRIGLTSGGHFLDNSAKVVLDFPYKDSVLKAGMTKEDEEDVDENYYHEIISLEEIDKMYDGKVLMNATKYDKNGVRPVSTFSEKDNLIIKGNNLIALHTLKERYVGQVKLIYIDPPYNTGSDSFTYNDNFNHSTWLTFMKNRLSIAKDLLREDGVIFINTDEVEQAYLKVLADEIFGRSNFIGDVIWRKRRGGGNDSHYIALDHDYIAVYAKNKSKSIHINKWRIPYEAEYLKRYKEYDEELNRRYYWDTLSRDGLQNPIVVEIDCPDGTTMTINSQKSKATILKEIDSGKVRITKTRNGWSIQHRVYQPEGRVLRSIIDDDKALNGIAKEEISDLFGANVFSNPKPEKLLNILINMATEENDIVLDFFMGSSTTQAVAHKMNRRYIGIEQMDYINTVSVPRLQKVIEGEQGGISKDVDWSDGGSFIYAELMPQSLVYIDKINDIETNDELLELWEDYIDNASLDFRVNLNELEDILGDAEISLENKKTLMVKAIDKNQMYLNYTEINDINIKSQLTETDIAFNESFYGGGEDE